MFDGVNCVETSAGHIGKLIADPAFDNITGKYFEGNKQKPSSNDSYNEEFWADLWTGCEKLTEVRFEITEKLKENAEL